MTTRPGTAARLMDAAALVLVVVGAALYVNAHSGMSDILVAHVRVPTKASLNFDRWLHFRTMSRLGLGLVAGGVALAVAAFYHSRRRSRALIVLPAADPPLDIPPNVTPR